MRIIDYKIVSGFIGLSSNDDLEVKVKAEILDGWQPHGGVSKCGTMTFMQAMVKYVPESK